MSVDYDLVVIGSSPEGIFAALSAAHLRARVALVEQPFKTYLGSFEAIYSRALTHFTRLHQQWTTAKQLDIYEPVPTLETPLQLPQIQAWVKEITAIIAEQQSPTILAAFGIDFIKGSGEFCRLPHQAFIVENRRLRSRAYLIATGSHPLIPKIDGIEEVGYLTTANFWEQDKLKLLPEHLVIINQSPMGIKLAQSLNRLGKNITLVVENKHILPAEDPEISRLIKAHLEAEGVHVFTQSLVTQVKQIESKKWLQIGNRGIETDEIILATQGSPNIKGLNLEGIGVCFEKQRIKLNEKLQTTNPRIYVCGDVAEGYSYSHLAQYEINIALKNALFLPFYKVDYKNIPWVIFTNPQLARVGMTEAQAKRRYGKKVLVVQQYFKNIPQAQVLGETTGFCKLIVHQDGTILGAHLIGPEVGELISALTLAIRNKMKINSMINFASSSLTLSEIIDKTVIEWQHQRFKRNSRLSSFLESLFICLRKWSN